MVTRDLTRALSHSASQSLSVRRRGSAIPTALEAGFNVDFNMSDVSSLTDDGAGLISNVASSVGGYNAAATTTQRGTSGTRTIQGLNTIDLNGTANGYRCDFQLTEIDSANGLTVQMLVELDVDGVTQSYFDNNDGGQREGNMRHDSSDNLNGVQVAADKASKSATGAALVAAGTAKVVSYVFDLPNLELHVYENDTLLGSNLTLTGAFRPSFVDCVIGADDALTGSFMNGKLGRFVAYDLALTPAQIALNSLFLNSANWGN